MSRIRRLLTVPGRFYVFLRSAELHEQTCPTDAVHVDAACMAALCFAGCKLQESHQHPLKQQPLNTCLNMAMEKGFHGGSRVGAA